MPDKKKAFLYVSDKTGIVELAHELAKMEFELLSAGSTAKTLKQSELEIEEVSFPLDISGIDLAAVNLYPITHLINQGSLTQKEVLEYFDINASSLLRSAAKNFEKTIALCDPMDYDSILETLAQWGEPTPEQRQNLAAKAFFYSSYYDSTLAQFLNPSLEAMPDELVIGLKKVSDLRYGENPHQKAALYQLSGARPWGLNALKILHGKELTFNHYLDLDIAWELVSEFGEPACAVVRHANPIAASSSNRPAEAVQLAYEADPWAAHGAVVAINRPVDEECAKRLWHEFVDCILAPDFSQEALNLLRAKKDTRLLTVPSALLYPNEIDLCSISGGVLIQSKNTQTLPLEIKAVTPRQPTETEMRSLILAWKTAKHSRSSAVVLAKGDQTIGIGSGQSVRLNSLKIAFAKYGELHPISPPNPPLVLASDGPLSPSLIQEAAKRGVTAIIQPGGSSDDKDSIKSCAEKNIAMAFTGLRHFRH